jgi:hypothetical protein
MQARYKATLLLLCCTALPCFAGGIKGPLISDTAIYVFVFYVIIAHALGIVTFVVNKLALRIVAGILYAPVFLIPIAIFFFSPLFGIITLLFALAFFIFMIIIPRNRISRKV